MFRRAVLDVIMSPESRCLRISADRYVFNFSHGLGGSLLIPSVHGCYRRHGINGFGANPVLGGESFLGDNRKDPADLVNVLIFQDILRSSTFSARWSEGDAIACCSVSATRTSRQTEARADDVVSDQARRAIA